MSADINKIVCRDLRKPKRKSKKAETEEKPKRGPPVPEMIEAVFRKDDKGFHAMIDGRRVALSELGDRTVSEGERWKCMVDRLDMYEPKLIPTMLIGKEPEEEKMEEEPEPCREESPAPVAVPSADTDSMKKNAELEKTNADLRRKLREAEKYKVASEELEKENKKLNRTVKSLSEQVRNLEKKTEHMKIQSLESEIDRMKNVFESQELEIERLRMKLRSLGEDDLKVSPRLPPVMKAIKNGSTLTFRNCVEDGRYAVFVNPRSHRLLLRRDAGGSIQCSNGTMHLECIGFLSVGGDAGPRQVGITATDEGYEVMT